MDKSTFIYLDPKLEHDNFQCSTCKMFLAKQGLCSLHGKNVKIKPTMSCNLWACCGPAPEDELEHMNAAFTPEESGLVDREVTCKYCEYYDADDSECLLFKTLNIDTKVREHGCCNAQTPIDDKKPATTKRKLKYS